MTRKIKTLDDFVEAVEFCGIDFAYVEREGPDVRFDLPGGRSFWIRATQDGGAHVEGVSGRRIAEVLTGLGAVCLKDSEGVYRWKP